jgi:hypothetical protein
MKFSVGQVWYNPDEGYILQLTIESTELEELGESGAFEQNFPDLITVSAAFMGIGRLVQVAQAVKLMSGGTE